MKGFGFLSFGHYQHGSPVGPAEMIRQAVDIGVGADELGVNGAYFRVHHFATQQASPMPLLTAIAAKTRHIEVGTGVIDMRYENPLYLAEEAAALDIIADQRLALGISRGSPEPAERGWESFGYTGSIDPRGADLARDKFDLFLRAIDGQPVAPAASGGPALPIEPRSNGLRDRIWWGSGSADTAEWTGRQGLNMMSSTLVFSDEARPLHEVQSEQIEHYRTAYTDAGFTRPSRVSVSRSIFPIASAEDAQMFAILGAREGHDGFGSIDGKTATFGKTYVGEPDQLVAALRADTAVMAADTLMITIPSQLGVDFNLRILESFARHIAPELGWQPNAAGPVTGYPAA
ncbi:LLM class flavin-dependent oxidoreductase [Gordonia sp. CPCC 205333]|uniref:LLM class flavin-dependent oxidoreductase n=1 Tax=Gordonia sp. CPCC 205333 TaxID=3140790 RepID=UPI003AF39522